MRKTDKKYMGYFQKNMLTKNNDEALTLIHLY